VGFAGGFLAGGGHGMLAGMYGLGADQTLEFEVITTDGEVLTVSPSEHRELYRALSGGVSAYSFCGPL
jgi:FAD/FMN-containing dehydrogenase